MWLAVALVRHADTGAITVYLVGDWPARLGIALVADRTSALLLLTTALLGGACLAAADLPERPDLGPWLACVLVEPEARGRGLAAQLIEAICAHASSLGIPRLYLHTHDQSAYYAKRGWQVLERFRAWDKEQWLMVRDL